MIKHDNFIKIEASPSNADRWIGRGSILKEIEKELPQLHGRLLDIGCGKMPYKELILDGSTVKTYIGLDIEYARKYDDNVAPDYTWDGRTMPFDDDSFDCALATEVFEHVGELQYLLREAKRVLKPGGHLFFTTPFIWPFHEAPHDHQRWTTFGLKAQLQLADLSPQDVRAVGNWHSSLAQLLGLWVARAPMPRWVRRCTRYPVFAAQKLLMRFDCDSDATDNSMPRLISGRAVA